MNIFTKLARLFLKSVVAFLFAMPILTSCVDGAAIWDKIDELEGRLDSLEVGLNGQIEAMNALLSGGDITISTLKHNDNGSYTITLSNGTKFVVLSESNGKNPLLSYIEEGNVKYWAIYDVDGVLVPLTDRAGKKIPVSGVVPTVVERDGAYYLMIDGKEYLTGYAQGDDVAVITGYEVNTDESGNAYSVTLKIGDEIFTLSIDGYKGFTFMLGSTMTGGNVIKDLYVANGSTYQIAAGLDGVIDYVMQIPDGWRVKEFYDEFSGELALSITAPTEETVAAGAGVNSGDLKVVAVVEGGDAMVAKLALSTDPFKTFKVTSTHAVIEKYNGVDKFIYGLTKFADFDEDALFADAPSVLQANDEDVTDVNINVELSALLGAELEPGVSYVLWAIPAFYTSDGQDAGYYVKDGLIVKHIFGGSAIHLAVSNLTFNDAKLSLSLNGVASYYGGTDELSETVYDDILYRINNEIIDPYTSPMTYNGSAFEFPTKASNEGLVAKSEASYVSWILPVTDGKETFTTDDIISQEFTLPGVTAGGAIKVTAGDPVISCVSVTTTLAAENATRIYYAFLTAKAASRHDDTTRAVYLLANGKIADGSTAIASVDKLEPETDMVLFAMATDASGKYGEVLIKEFTTSELVYNSLQVTVTPIDVGGNKASCSVTVAGGEALDLVYWVGRETDQFWMDRLGNTTIEKRVDAQKYIALYPDDSDVKRAMSSYKLENGVLTMTDLKTETVHFVIVLAKDASGKYSKAGHWQFTTLAADLGNVVKAGTSEWESIKSQVNIQWHKDKFRMPANSNMTAFYAFDITVPSNLTAYILCMSDKYFESNPDTQTMAEKIIDIESQCSRKYDAGKVPYGKDGEYAQEPDWVDDEGKTHTGTLVNLYDFYVHGYPTNGFATYFATGSHIEDNCTAWRDGECSNYAYALEHITERLTLDYYIEYVKNNRGAYCTKNDVIQKAAQDLLDTYYPYYENAKPLVYINDGSPLYMENHYASGIDDEGNVVDDVFVVFKDSEGNYYEPMSFEVPNYFK